MTDPFSRFHLTLTPNVTLRLNHAAKRCFVLFRSEVIRSDRAPLAQQ